MNVGFKISFEFKVLSCKVFKWSEWVLSIFLKEINGMLYGVLIIFLLIFKCIIVNVFEDYSFKDGKGICKMKLVLVNGVILLIGFLDKDVINCFKV